jgi:hypothetical protein
LGATGPFFISIGDEAKLAKFLEVNPTVPREKAFVDDVNMGAYDAVGFGKLEIGGKLPENFSLKPPEMGGFGGWWKYLSNVASVSPAPSDSVSSEQVLETVSRLGGTFVVNGDKVVYQWNDAIPGDTPDLTDVLDAVKKASVSA